MSNKLDINEILRHQTRLARLETQGYRAHIAPSLAAALRDIRRLLADVDNITSQRQLRAIETAITKVIQEQPGWAALTGELETMANYENQFYAKLIASGTTAASAERVARMANNTMMVLRSGEKYNTGLWPDFARNNLGSQAQRVNNIVRTGYAQGLTGREMRREISKLYDGILAREAEALARTGYSHYSKIGRQAFAEANKDIVTREIPVVTFDSRLSSVCASISARYGEKGWPVGKSPIGYEPFHFNCLFEDSFITSGYGVTSVSKRRFKGTKVTIRTSAGNNLSVTPNHPVLTDRGWVAAELVNISDKLFLQSATKHVTGIDWNNYYIETRVDNMFDSFGSSAHVLTREVPISPPDFHGDGADNEVAVIHSNSLLLSEVITNTSEDISKLKLKLGNGCEVFFSCDGSKFFFAGSLLSPGGGLISSFSELLDLLGRRVLHSSELLLGSVPDVNAILRKNPLDDISGDIELRRDTFITDSGFVNGYDVCDLLISKLDDAGVRFFNSKAIKPFIDSAFADAKLVCDSPDAYAGGVELTDVVEVEFTHVDNSYVYNIETVDNCYSANGIITHNCRTTTVPLAEGQELTGTRASKGDEPGQIRASTSIESFVRSQSKGFQEELLGVERAKLFREGKLSLRNLTDASMRPLTLDQIRALEG